MVESPAGAGVHRGANAAGRERGALPAGGEGPADHDSIQTFSR